MGGPDDLTMRSAEAGTSGDTDIDGGVFAHLAQDCGGLKMVSSLSEHDPAQAALAARMGSGFFNFVAIQRPGSLPLSRVRSDIVPPDSHDTAPCSGSPSLSPPSGGIAGSPDADDDGIVESPRTEALAAAIRNAIAGLGGNPQLYASEWPPGASSVFPTDLPVPASPTEPVSPPVSVSTSGPVTVFLSGVPTDPSITDKSVTDPAPGPVFYSVGPTKPSP